MLFCLRDLELYKQVCNFKKIRNYFFGGLENVRDGGEVD